MLPNGKEYCVEDARTTAQRDSCAGDLEDALYTSNEKGLTTWELVDKAIDRLKLSRNPCGFWRGIFQRSKCKID